MSRFVFLVALLIAANVKGAIQANAIIHPDGQTRGLLTIAIVSNISYGLHGPITYGGTNGSFVRIFLDSAQDTNQFRTPISVTGTNYDGISTNWIRLYYHTNGDPEYIDWEFPGGSGGSISNVLMAGWMRMCLTNDLAQQVNLDHTIIYGGGGSWCVCQMGLSFDNVLQVNAHAATNGVSTFGPGILPIPCKTYFRVLYRDPRGGRCCMKIYDPLNWSLVGESCSGMSGGSVGDNSWTAQIKVGYIGNPPENVYIGDTFFIYDATDSDYTNVLTGLLFTNTINNATIRNATIGQ